MKAFAPTMRVFATAVLALTGTSVVNADTIATFADPSPDGSQPLFAFSSSGAAGTLSGSWTSTGMLLQTPGLAAPDFPNARFVMAPVAATGGPVLWTLGSGRIRLQNSSGVDQMFIDFNGGTLTTPVGFGGSDFVGLNVTFSGPIITSPLSQEAFAFSFANPVGTPENYTVTASFTSSAIPEPASVLLVVIGGMVAVRRRS